MYSMNVFSKSNNGQNRTCSGYVEARKRALKRCKKIVSSLLIVCSFVAVTYGQLKTVVKIEDVTIPPQVMDYRPKIHVETKTLDDFSSDYLFIASNTGLCEKQLYSYSAVLYGIYAFFEIPIIDYVSKGNMLLGIAAGHADSMLFLSPTYGNAVNYTSNLSNTLQSNSPLIHIIQNPLNPNTVVIAAQEQLFFSFDFGKHWSYANLNINSVHGKLAIHPLDTTLLFCVGENNAKGTALRTVNFGNSWQEYTTPDIDNIHDIAFHPELADIIYFCSDRYIGKSSDKGISWNLNKMEKPIIKLFFDDKNPNRMYAIGFINEQISLYLSDNAGESWLLTYQAYCPDILDVIKHRTILDQKEKLFIYTMTGGILELNLSSYLTTTISTAEKIGISIWPNPAADILYYHSDYPISRIDIFDMMGRLIKSERVCDNGQLDMTDLIFGTYIVCFKTSASTIKHKIIIK